MIPWPALTQVCCPATCSGRSGIRICAANKRISTTRRHPRPRNELEKRVDSGEMTAASPLSHAHGGHEAVAEAGKVMPTKSPGSSPSWRTGWYRMLLDGLGVMGNG